MTTVTIHQGHLTRQVRDLRERGMSVKQIARTLGEKASDIAPLVNAIAAENTPQETDPGVVGCWVSPGWSTDLTVHGHPDWRDSDDTADFPGGIAAVLVARRHRTNRVSVCGYLVDTYCLGVKDALGPRVMSDRDLPTFVHVFFDGFGPAGPPLRAPLELARHLRVRRGRSRAPARLRPPWRLRSGRRAPRTLGGEQRDHVRQARRPVLRSGALRPSRRDHRDPDRDRRRGQLHFRRTAGPGRSFGLVIRARIGYQLLGRSAQ